MRLRFWRHSEERLPSPDTTQQEEHRTTETIERESLMLVDRLMTACSLHDQAAVEEVIRQRRALRAHAKSSMTLPYTGMHSDEIQTIDARVGEILERMSQTGISQQELTALVLEKQHLRRRWEVLLGFK